MKPFPMLAIFVLFCSWAGRGFAQSQADWPYLRGPGNTGVSTQKLTPLSGEPERLWKAMGPSGNGGVVVASGLAYIYGTGKENLVCLNATTGEKLWAQENIGEYHGNQTPAVVGGRLYFQASKNVNDHATAHCLNAQTGAEIWKRQLPKPAGERHYGHAASALIAGDRVIFNAGGGVALKRETGEVIWEFEGLPGMATPVLFQHQGRGAVAIFLGNRMVARDLAGGGELWSIPWRTELGVNAHHPLVFDGRVFINSGYGLGRALYDISTGVPTELWKFGEYSGHPFAASILHGGLIYGFFENGLACLDPSDGSLKWKTPGSGSLLLIDGKLVWVTEKGELHIGPVSADGFEPETVAQIHGGVIRNNPAYANGNLILRNEDGAVVCVRIAR